MNPRWLLLLSALGASIADARPGGGESYSNGPDGDGGGGGDSIALVRFLIWLLIRHPTVGVPVTIAVIVWFIYTKRQRERAGGWVAGEAQRPARRPVSARRTLDKVRAIDPGFSLVLFEDFVYALYARAHEARGSGSLAAWSTWLSEPARAWLSALAPGAKVEGIVVGALSIRSVSGVHANDPETVVSVELEANYDERGASFYANETWIFTRKTSAKSRPPDRVLSFDCPSCGAKSSELRESKCAYCGATVDTGAFDWLVTGISGRRQSIAPRLTGTVHERGTSLPTVIAPDAKTRLDELLARDPKLTWADTQARVRLVHAGLNEAWSSRQYKKARPFVTDSLFQTQLYWIQCYERAGLTNKNDGAAVQRIELASIHSDAFYDALTVRVYATGKDYTVRDEDGSVVAGSRTAERPYSEYWTLLRGRSVTHAATTTASCPSCGAGLDVGMTGQCAYCNAKITSGAFDWVLSRIEQDESYTG